MIEEDFGADALLAVLEEATCDASSDNDGPSGLEIADDDDCVDVPSELAFGDKSILPGTSAVRRPPVTRGRNCGTSSTAACVSECKISPALDSAEKEAPADCADGVFIKHLALDSVELNPVSKPLASDRGTSSSSCDGSDVLSTNDSRCPDHAGSARPVLDVTSFAQLATSPLGQQAIGRSLSEAVGTSESCTICFDEVSCDDLGVWRCPIGVSGHTVCGECALPHVRALLDDRGVVPACPVVGCLHVLKAEEVRDIIDGRRSSLAVSDAEASALVSRDAVLRKRAEMTKRGVLSCPAQGCEGVAVSASGAAPGAAQAIACGDCGQVFCTACKQQPFHYHCLCDEVIVATRQWQDWLREGQSRYLEAVAVHDDRYKALLNESKQRQLQHERILREAEQRLEELERMEEWKEQHCRHCTACSRLVEKVDGCDQMSCGQNFHGGDVQNGCGAKFLWGDAKRYKRALVGDPTYRKVQNTTIALGAAARRPPKEDLLGEWLRPSSGDAVRCDVCRQPVRGPKFTCLHCPEVFTVCQICVADHTSLIPLEGASSSCLPGRLHRHSHVFRISWNPALEGFVGDAAALWRSGSDELPAPQLLLERLESKCPDDDRPFVSSAAWAGPVRGFVFCRGPCGLGYYRGQEPSREATLQQQARAMLLQINSEIKLQGGGGLEVETRAIAGVDGAFSLAEWSRSLFRFGVDLLSAERETLLRALDPEGLGRVAVEQVMDLLRSAERWAEESAHLLQDVLAGGGLPSSKRVASAAPAARLPTGDQPPSPIGLAPHSVKSRLVRSETALLRCRASKLCEWRRRAAEDIFVCLGGTPLLKLRRSPRGHFQRIASATRGEPVGEEFLVRLVASSPAASGGPALSWERPASEERLAPSASRPRRLLSAATANPFWRTRVLPLDHVAYFAYAPPRAAGAAEGATSAPSVDRARLFCLWTRSGRGFDFMARSTSDAAAWALTLSRVLRARGVYTRTWTRRAFALRLVQARVEMQAEAYRMSVKDVWMVALRRAAEALRLPFREVEGCNGMGIAAVSKRG